MISPFRLLAVVLKELQHLRRDRLTYAMIIGIPVFELLLFGYAINFDVRNLPTAVVNQAGTSRSREVVEELQHSEVLQFRYRHADLEEADQLMRAGRIKAILIVPPDFEHRLQDGRPALQLVVDGSDQVVQQAAGQLALFPVRLTLGDTPLAAGSTDIEVLPYYNPRRKAPINTVPGLIGVILTMTMVLFTAIALVREREQGNLEFLITTPLSSAELLLGKVLPYVLIGLIQMTLVLILGYVIFQVPMRGSLLDLYLATALFIAANLALGIFISTLVATQFQSVQATIFTFLPQILLSGFMFPYEGMPRGAQWLAETLPLTHFLRLVRGIMLRGEGLAGMWIDLLTLALFALLALTLAIRRVHKRLD